MIINNKEFKEIPGYDKYVISCDGELYSKWMKRLMKAYTPAPSSNRPYISYNIRYNGKTTWITLHRLLALAWLQLPEGYSYTDVEHGKKNLVVDHIDGNKFNNDLSNLRWVTQSDNVKNSNRSFVKGNKGNKHATYSPNRYTYVYKGKTYKSMKQVAKAMGVSTTSYISEAFRHNFRIVQNGTLQRFKI